MSRRQSYLYANAPAYTDNRRNGNQWETSWNPTSAGEWNVSHNTQ